MSKFGVTVMGPAGAGKSTFCTSLIQHLQHSRRSSFYVNLDPAATDFKFEPDIDIRDLISLDDVMDELSLGPNGGLLYCLQFLLDNLDFLMTPLESLTENYLIIFDMPGQVELYTHSPILPGLFKHLRHSPLNFNLCATYLLESSFIIDQAKLFAGTLSAMSAMLLLEMPHINVISKMDLVTSYVSKQELRHVLNPSVSLLEEIPIFRGETRGTSREAFLTGQDRKLNNDNQLLNGNSFRKLNKAVAELVEDFGMINFQQLNACDEDSIGVILSQIDNSIQYHEAQEPREPVEIPDGDN